MFFDVFTAVVDPEVEVERAGADHEGVEQGVAEREVCECESGAPDEAEGEQYFGEENVDAEGRDDACDEEDAEQVVWDRLESCFGEVDAEVWSEPLWYAPSS